MPTTGDDGLYRPEGSDDAAPVTELLAAFAESLPRFACGSVYGGAAVTTVNFPADRFRVAPTVIAVNAENIARAITAITAAGFTYQNAVGANATLNWFAMEAH